MNMLQWTQFINQTRTQPARGDYADWKPDVSQYCGEQCTYCCIPISRYGGIDNFHVDHFRPKSKPQFAHLRKAIDNLYLACAICNRFKSDHWPNDPANDHSVPAFPDPLISDYNGLFEFDGLRAVGRYVAARYVVEQLYLNRPQLLRERRLATLRAKVAAASARLKELCQLPEISDSSDATILQDVIKCRESMERCKDGLIAAYEGTPYDLSEIRRPSRR